MSMPDEQSVELVRDDGHLDRLVRAVGGAVSQQGRRQLNEAA